MGTPFCDGRKWQDNGPFGDIVVRQLEIAQESVRYGCFESRRPGFWGVWGGRLLHFCAPFRSQGRLKVAPRLLHTPCTLFRRTRVRAPRSWAPPDARHLKLQQTPAFWLLSTATLVPPKAFQNSVKSARIRASLVCPGSTKCNYRRLECAWGRWWLGHLVLEPMGDTPGAIL